MLILSQIFTDIKKTFIHAPIESGGIIGIKKGVVCAFHFDEGNYNYDCYIPNVDRLNKIILEWAKADVQFAGVVHSHHNDCRYLSDTDKKYALEVLKATKVKPLYFPVITICNGEAMLSAYSVCRHKFTKEEVYIQ